MSIPNDEDPPHTGALDGPLAQGLDNWRHLHSLGLCSNLLLSIITSGLRLKLTRPLHHPIILPELPHSPEELVFIRSEVADLLAAGRIEHSHRPLIVSPIFAVPKKRPPDDPRPRFRLVHNLRTVNNLLIPVNHYRLPKLDDVEALLNSGALTAAVDVEAAYHHILIDPASRPLLAFTFEGECYQWTVCPFGLTHSAYYWVMTSKALVSWVHHHGIKAVMYCDDLLLICSPEQFQLVLRLLSDLGVRVAMHKLQPPSHQTVFLGHVILTPPELPPSISLTQARARAARHAAITLVRLALRGSMIIRRELARHLGTIASTVSVVPSTHLLLRPIHHFLMGHPSGAWDMAVTLDQTIIPGLNAWLLCLRERPQRLLLQLRSPAQITTDASHVGWGAVLVIPDEDIVLSSAGDWSQIPHPLPHITMLESIAVDHALRLWASLLANRLVLIRSDATVVVHVLRRLTSRSIAIAELFSRLSIEVLEPNNIRVSTTHLAGILNTRADAASRLLYLQHDKHDYILRPQLALSLIRAHCPEGVPPVDRFASDVNALLPLYNARRSLQPGIVDAFLVPTLHWTGQFNYMFPPCSSPVISRLLSHLTSLPPINGLLILPRWPGATWWPLLIALPGLQYVQDLHSDAFLPGLSGSCGPANGRWMMCAWKVSSHHDSSPAPTASN